MKTLSTFILSSINFFLRPASIIRGYQIGNLRFDLIAGLTVAVIMLPQAMAYALIAGLPPQMGLYAAIVGSIVGALWGSSNQLQTGPSNAISLLVLSILLPLVSPETPAYWVAAGVLALMVGIIQSTMGLARLGMLVNFVSDSVIVGFTAGAGVLIFFNQIRNLMRVNIPASPAFMNTVRNLALQVDEAHWISIALGVGVVALIVVLRKVNPKLPGSLIAIVLAALVVGLFDLELMGVIVIGELPKGFPPFASLPVMDLEYMSQLLTGALAIAAIGIVEAVSIARSIAGQTGQRLDSNQEFIGQGLANIASGLFSGYNTSGSFVRSAVNHQSGGKSPISNVFAGLIILVVLLIFGSLAAYVPLAALAGVVLVAAVRLVDREEIVRIWKGAPGDRAIMVVTLVATLTLPLEYAVLLGIVLSLGYYLVKTSMPTVRVLLPDDEFRFLITKPDKPECPQLTVIEIMGDLYFGAVNHVEDFILRHLDANPGQRYLLLRMQNVDQFDISGVHALERIRRAYRKQNGDIFISRIRDPVMETMRASGFYASLGADHFLTREENAIGYLFHRVLDPAICIYECPFRAFQECQNLPKRLDLVGEHLHLDISTRKVSFTKPRELWDALQDDNPPAIIDVREPREFQQGHIQGARLISLPQLLADPSQVPRTGPVVLTCRTGRRSSRVAGKLIEMGYDNLKVLDGGLLAWEADNLLEAIE